MRTAMQNPVGFVTDDLAEGPDGSAIRRHAWNATGGNPDIHQHRADIERSEVERGVLEERIWTYVDDPDGDHYRVQVICWVGPDDVYHVDEKSPRVRCRVKVASTEIHRAGETYSRDARVLHTVTALEAPASTVCRAGPVYQEVHMLIRPVGDEEC